MEKFNPSALSDVRFLDLKAMAGIPALKDGAKYPVPVQLTEGTEPGLESIGAGLIKVLAEEPSYLKNIDRFKPMHDDERQKVYDYYRALLLLMRPQIEEELIMAGIAKTSAKDYAFAEQILTAAKNIGHSERSYINLAVLYANQSADLLKAKRTKESQIADERIVQVLHEGLKQHPKSYDIMAELGGFHLRHKDLDIAREFFEDSLKDMPDSERRQQIQALSLELKAQLDQDNAVLEAYDQIMMGNEAKALETIEKHLKVDPDGWEGWYIKGWALRCLERYDEARTALLKSVSKDPEISATYNELSICEKESGNLPLAREYLEMAVDLEDDNVIYLANLAYLYLLDKDFSHARYYLDRARTVDPSDNQMLDLMDEYEALSGEKLGPAVVEEILSADEVRDLAKRGENDGRVKEV